MPLLLKKPIFRGKARKAIPRKAKAKAATAPRPKFVCCKQGKQGKRGKTGKQGQRGIPGSVDPLTHLLFVDPAADPLVADGSISTPYQTIQAAINTIPAGSVSAPNDVYVVWVSPATYDEDLAIDGTNRRIVITGWGPWNLGLFDTTDGLASNSRNITWTIGSVAQINGIRSSLAIGTSAYFGEGLSTIASYSTGARISGKISVVSSAGTNGAVTLIVQGEIFGRQSNGSTGASIDTSGFQQGVETYLYRGRCRGTVGGSAGSGLGMQLQWADRYRFDGAITMLGYSRMQNCQFRENISVTQNTNTGVLPDGINNCQFVGAKTFTYAGLGTATGSLRLDGNSNYWFKTNGWSLAGGATKVIQDDLVA